MKVIVKEIESKRDLKEFVVFPNKLYKGNPYYVPQLISADMDSLNPKKNHAFEFCEGKYWGAYDEKGKMVGRIAGIINHEYNRKMNTMYVRFGWMDFIDDVDVVNALFDTMEAWAKSRGAEYICGPLGFLEFDIAGVLVEGFDQLPTAYGKYNAPYYAGHLERRGYVKDVDWIEYRTTIPDKMPENVDVMAQRLAERYEVKALQFTRKKDLMKYADQVFELMNHEYGALHGFSNLSPGQVEDLKNQFIPLLNLKYVVLIVDKNDKLISFSFCLPSLSKALQKANGHLFPFGFLHIKHALRKNDVIDSLLVAVASEYRSKGITAIVFSTLAKRFIEDGYKAVESTRQLEENHSVRNLWNRYEYVIHKRARAYMKKVND